MPHKLCLVPAGFDSPVFCVEQNQELERLHPRVHLAGSQTCWLGHRLATCLVLPGLASFSYPLNGALAAAELLGWVQGPLGCSGQALAVCALWKWWKPLIWMHVFLSLGRGPVGVLIFLKHLISALLLGLLRSFRLPPFKLRVATCSLWGVWEAPPWREFLIQFSWNPWKHFTMI